MRVESKASGDGRDEYVVDAGDGRRAFLTVRRGSHPVQIESGLATGPTVATSADQAAAVDELGTWLVAEILAGRA